MSIWIVTFFILFTSSHFYAWLAMTLYSPPRDPQFYRLHMPAWHNKGGIRHFLQSLRSYILESPSTLPFPHFQTKAEIFDHFYRPNVPPEGVVDLSIAEKL